MKFQMLDVARPPAFLVENIGPEGGVRWLADIYQSELELVSSGP